MTPYAGDPGSEKPTSWQQLAGAADAISTEYAHHAGIYAAGEKLVAVNRSPAEDQAAILSDERTAELLFTGRIIDAQTAYDIRLVSSLVPHDELMPRAIGQAMTLTQVEPRLQK